MLHQQLFLLNANLNSAILRSRNACVQVWELQLVGVKADKIYSLQELQASYKAAAKVMLSLISSKHAHWPMSCSPCQTAHTPSQTFPCCKAGT